MAMKENGSKTIQTSNILQNRITASQDRVKMEAFAIIPPLDIHTAAIIIILGTTAIVNVVVVIYITKSILIISYV